VFTPPQHLLWLAELDLRKLTAPNSVAENLKRAKAESHEALPKLAQDACTLLGADLAGTQRRWQEVGHSSPPVMTVCNEPPRASIRMGRSVRSGASSS
jgi:hypothetical protein